MFMVSYQILLDNISALFQVLQKSFEATLRYVIFQKIYLFEPFTLDSKESLIHLGRDHYFKCKITATAISIGIMK